MTAVLAIRRPRRRSRRRTPRAPRSLSRPGVQLHSILRLRRTDVLLDALLPGGSRGRDRTSNPGGAAGERRLPVSIRIARRRTRQHAARRMERTDLPPEEGTGGRDSSSTRDSAERHRCFRSTPLETPSACPPLRASRFSAGSRSRPSRPASGSFVRMRSTENPGLERWTLSSSSFRALRRERSERAQDGTLDSGDSRPRKRYKPRSMEASSLARMRP